MANRASDETTPRCRDATDRDAETEERPQVARDAGSGGHTQQRVEEALNMVDSSTLNLAPTATAVELPAEPEPQPASRKSQKTARVHEVMDMDPTDSNYVFCQCLKSAGGGVCGARLKSRWSCTALWTHVKKKHASTYSS